MDLQKLCRLCLKESTNFFLLNDCFQESQGTSDLTVQSSINKIQEIFQLKDLTHPDLPNKVCRFCESRVSELYDYWSMVNRNQEQLLSYLNCPQSLSTSDQNHEADILYEDSPTDPEPFESTVEKVDSNFNKISSFLSSEEQKLPKKPMITCSKCDKQFNSRGALHFHQLSHLSESDRKKLREENTCSDCGARFLVAAKLLYHQRTQHGLEDSQTQETQAQLEGKMKLFFGLNCLECEAEFETYNQWKRHMTDEHQLNKPFLTCCGKNFTNRQQVIEHLNFHTDSNKYRCPHCDTQFTRKSYLKRHIESYHTAGGMGYQCDLCLKRFPSRSSIRKHMLVHLSAVERRRIKNLNRCHLCTASFLVPSMLSFHIRTVHEKKSEIICDICAKTYPTKASYRMHYRDTHEFKNKITCEICGDALANIRTLTRHMRTKHDTSGPHNCPKCSYTSMSLYLFNQHQKVHSPFRKRYPCKVCDKVFVRLRGLKEHLPVHTGIFLYECEWCAYACNSLENMKKHLRKNHPQNDNDLTKNRKIKNNKKMTPTVTG